MKPQAMHHQHLETSAAFALSALCLIFTVALSTDAILVQPHNYMLDDSSLVSQHDTSGSLSPFYNDQNGGSEQSADKDIVSIIGDSLARLRYGRMFEGSDELAQPNGHFSQEMAELIHKEQQAAANQDGSNSAGEQTLSSSVASMLMNVAQAASQSAQANNDDQELSSQQSASGESPLSSRGSIMELDTTSSSLSSANSQPSKADLKQGPIQWFNPKETIPVLKISSMATPSKYKKVYFRSEKKLVDGAFHSPSGEQTEKKSIVKPLSSEVQRRSSRGTGSNVPPSLLQDGVIDFLKKFRDVYVQTRPAGASSANLASSMVSAAASSPFASVLAPGGGRPNLASALSAASQMVNSAAMLSQAASSQSALSSTSGSSPSAAAGTAGGAAAAAAPGAASNPNRSPLTAQSYVSFWSKTFPTWVRKMLKQMRRRSLYNSSKRQQQQQHHHHHASIGQKIASGAVSSVVESATSGSSASGNSGSAS